MNCSKTIIYVTHDLNEALELSDLVIMKEGKIVKIDSPHKVFV